jgi:hypothetical protein
VTMRALEGDILPPAPKGAPAGVFGDQVAIVAHRSPFDRQPLKYLAPYGATIADMADMLAMGPTLRRHLEALVGDALILPQDWARVRPKPGAVVFFRVRLAGGDDGEGKNPLRAILMLAVTVMAAKIGGLIPGTGFLATALRIGVQVAVLAAGTALINALIPPPRAPDPRFGFDSQPGNPYATLTGLRNNFPPAGSTIPRIKGRRRVFPLLAARSYTENEGSSQYLRILLLVGYGPVRLSEIRIGNTPITAFSDVQIETREGWNDDPPITLFTRIFSEEGLSIGLNPSNGPTGQLPADGISGTYDAAGDVWTPSVTDPGGWAVRTTATNTSEISIDVTFPQGLATYDKSGNRQSRTVELQVQWRALGGSWQNASWIDGKAEYGTSTAGVLRCADSAGQTIVRSGRWSTGAAGQYEVRLRRSTAAGDNRTVDSAYWTALRSIRSDAPIAMAGLSTIALRIKATQQLNGVPDSISVLAEAYEQTWNGSVWTWAISRNPAWQCLDLMRRRGGQQPIPDARIDFPSFYAWAAACEATAPNASEPRWAFDAVLEGGSIAQNLRQIAAHGRGAICMVDGKISVVRDAQQTVPVQHISPRNSANYRGRKAFVDIPHAFRVRFVNAAAEYRQDETIVYRDGYSAANATKFEGLDMPGCTSASQAWREGRYHFAQLLLRPEEHEVDMDVEAIRVTYGDLVRFSHDVISIGIAAARIEAVILDGQGRTSAIRLDTVVSMTAGVTYAARVRLATGASSLHTLTTIAGSSDTLTLATPVTAATGPQTGDHVQFGVQGSETAPMLVKRILPRADFSATVVMVDAQDGVYSADTGTIPAFNSFITVTVEDDQAQPGTPSFFLTSNETAIERLADGTVIERILVNIRPGGASRIPAALWEAEYRPTSSTSDWLAAGTATPQAPVIAIRGVTRGQSYDVRVRAKSAAGTPSDWVTALGHVVVGKAGLPPAPSNFTATPSAEGVLLAWTPASGADIAGYEIRAGADWATGAVLHRLAPGPNWFVALADTQAQTTFWIKTKDRFGQESTNALSASATPNTNTLALRLLTEFEDAFPAKTDFEASQMVLQAEMVRNQQARDLMGELGLVDGVPLGTTLTTMSLAREEGDTALAQTISLIGARTVDGTAFILDGSTARVSPAETLAQRFSTLSAADTSAANSLATVSTQITALQTADTTTAETLALLGARSGDNSAFILNQSTTKVTAAYSFASWFTDVNTAFNSQSASISQVFETVYNASTGLTARAAVRVTAGGHVSGWMSTANPSGSNFTIVSNTFALVDPNGGNPITPFTYDNGLVKLTNVQAERFRVVQSGRRLVMGPGVGANTDLLMWFGSDTEVASGAETTGNSAFAMTTGGQVFYGGSELAKGQMTASASPASISGTHTGAGYLASNQTTVTPSGGTAPHTYSWIVQQVLEGASPNIGGAATATAAVNLTLGAGQSASGYLRCTVRDNAGRVAFADVYYGLESTA